MTAGEEDGRLREPIPPLSGGRPPVRPAGGGVPSTAAGPASREHLALADLDAGDCAHVRVDISKDTVSDYAELLKDGRRFPPITVFRTGGKLCVADGFHRVAAYVLAGRTHIEADVHEGDEQAALWFELGANAAHGRRLSRAETRRAVGLVLDRYPDASSKLVAEHVGCGSALVAKVRRQRERDSAGSPERQDVPVRLDEPAAGGAARSGSPRGGVASGEPASLGGGRSRAPYVDPEDAAGEANAEPPSERSSDQSNRILSDLAQDAATFSDQLHLVDFRTVDPVQLPGWIASLETGRREINKLIKRLEALPAAR